MVCSRSLLFVFFTFSALWNVDGCRKGYETLFNGKCIKFVKYLSSCGEVDNDKEKANCDNEGGFLTILRSKEEGMEFAKLITANYSTHWVNLGIHCDFHDGKWKWDDGSAMDYIDFDKPALNDHCDSSSPVALRHDNSLWTTMDQYSKCVQTIFCQERDVKSDAECGSFSPIGTAKSDVCLEVQRTPMTYAEAQLSCRNQNADLASIHGKEENDYIRRALLGLGATGEIYIGTNLVSEPKNVSWIDDTPMDYKNFEQSNPNSDIGECVAMNVQQRGQWGSVDCGMKLPFVCTRPTLADSKALAPPVCPSPNKFGVGDHIYSPNFPVSTITNLPCDYIITVPKGQLVDLEVKFFETNKDRDVLQIFDNSLDANLLYNITGSNHAGERYFSKTSNTVRLHWSPMDGKGVRGWHFVVRSGAPSILSV